MKVNWDAFSLTSYKLYCTFKLKQRLAKELNKKGGKYAYTRLQ